MPTWLVGRTMLATQHNVYDTKAAFAKFVINDKKLALTPQKYLDIFGYHHRNQNDGKKLLADKKINKLIFKSTKYCNLYWNTQGAVTTQVTSHSICTQSGNVSQKNGFK